MNRATCIGFIVMLWGAALIARYGFGVDSDLWFEQKGWTIFLLGIGVGIHFAMPDKGKAL